MKSRNVSVIVIVDIDLVEKNVTVSTLLLCDLSQPSANIRISIHGEDIGCQDHAKAEDCKASETHYNLEQDLLIVNAIRDDISETLNPFGDILVDIRTSTLGIIVQDKEADEDTAADVDTFAREVEGSQPVHGLFHSSGILESALDS